MIEDSMNLRGIITSLVFRGWHPLGPREPFDPTCPHPIAAVLSIGQLKRTGRIGTLRCVESRQSLARSSGQSR